MNRDEALRDCLQAKHVRRFDDPLEVCEHQKLAKRAERGAHGRPVPTNRE
jgi:hypothetical protein